MKNQRLILKQLDEQLREWQVLAHKFGRPKEGWIRTIRKALSMTTAQLAEHMGLSRARAVQMESAEINDAITIKTLHDAAEALNCDLVYALVPKGNSSLEDILKSRAQEVAEARVAYVAHSMSLENQSVNRKTLKLQQDELVNILLQRPNKKLWANEENKNEIKRLKLIENLKKKK